MVGPGRKSLLSDRLGGELAAHRGSSAGRQGRTEPSGDRVIGSWRCLSAADQFLRLEMWPRGAVGSAHLGDAMGNFARTSLQHHLVFG